MPKKIPPKLIEKYLRGECSEEEAALVERLYDAYEEEPDPLQVLPGSQREELKQTMLEGIKDQIRTEEFAAAEGTGQGKNVVLRRIGLALSGVAAAIVLAVGLVWVKREEPGKIPVAARPASIPWVVMTNSAKVLQKHRLPDGSLAWLSPGARLEFPRSFGLRQRTVRMTGETFFEVTKDSIRPFIIYSGEMRTTVLGTSFRIKAAANASFAEVLVVTGKVAVSVPRTSPSPGATSRPLESNRAQTKEVLLLPNQKATFLKTTHRLDKEVVNSLATTQIGMWHKRDISFDNVPMHRVVAELNRKFGVRIRIENEELNACLLKADFSDQNLPSILELVGKSLDATYEMEGTDISLKGNGCK